MFKRMPKNQLLSGTPFQDAELALDNQLNLFN